MFCCFSSASSTGFRNKTHFKFFQKAPKISSINGGCAFISNCL